MKTNHQRSFKGKRHTYKGGSYHSGVSTFADKEFGGYVEHDAVRGNRGHRRSVAGAKKFVRSRIRFHEKLKVKEEAKHL